MKRVTLADIARHCGVSVNTVSHALKDKPDISEATKEMIRRAAAQMGYIQNASASYLRSGVSKSIAIILGDISNPHFSIMVKEMEVIARKNGYTTFVLNTEEDEELEREAIVAAISKNVDGIIICPVQKSEENIKFLMNSHMPFTLIGRRFEHLNTNYVVCDDVNSGYIAAEYILGKKSEGGKTAKTARIVGDLRTVEDMGPYRTAIITTEIYVSSAKERLQGVKDYYKENGICLKQEDIYCVPLSSLKRGDYLRQIAEKGYDSAICFNDILALELLTYAPGIDIVSFDNIRSKFSMPYEFASVTSSKTKMSDNAIRILLDAMEGKQEVVQMVLPTKIS